eukprot:TRINITY_DN9544_c0_g1_i1.p1 TRINITY_DN9544_c0_g1~~TRINITY_DN9544_c0_g1_i1.p1  ORF type:complete len:443 (-),score=89.24 TRINITY_DN9544_c0_g1_i1:46-1335(-)
MRLIVLVVAVCFLCSEAAIYKGALKTTDRWHYLGKFCFSNTPNEYGRFQFTINTANQGLQIMLYLSTQTEGNSTGAWADVYNNRNTYSCQELVNKHLGTAIKNITSGLTDVWETSSSVRPYYWYVAVADCSSATGIDIDSYDLVFLNPGGQWFTQFSFDEQEVLQYYIFFTLWYLGLLIAHAWGVWQLIKTHSFHPIVRLLTASLTCATVSILCITIHYGIYKDNGVGAPGLRGLGELMSMSGELLLMFLCILIGKGWAISTIQLSGRNQLIISMSIFVVSYLALFIWDNAGRDPASTNYFYDSYPGYIVIALRVALAGWLVWNLRGTLRLESLPEKRKFYHIFGSFYTIWFLMLPFLVLIALAFADYLRFKLIQGMLVTVDALAFAALVALLWPTRAAQIFDIKAAPYLLSQDGGKYGATASAMSDDL